MQKVKHNSNEKQRPKSALKKDLSTRYTPKRFDRKGQEIKFGSKYEVTINDKAQLLTEGDERNPNDNPDDLNSPKTELNETITKFSNRSPKNLELNSKEEAFLKMLSQNLEKNKRRQKQKECCLIF